MTTKNCTCELTSCRHDHGYPCQNADDLAKQQDEYDSLAKSHDQLTARLHKLWINPSVPTIICKHACNKTSCDGCLNFSGLDQE